jgi:hypothetical protein
MTWVTWWYFVLCMWLYLWGGFLFSMDLIDNEALQRHSFARAVFILLWPVLVPAAMVIAFRKADEDV